jgi:hypothetical protein
MDKPWFRVHKFWGWYPISWQAWLTISTMAISVASILFLVILNSNSVSETLVVAFPPISLVVTLAIFISLLKGEKPSFGKENSKSRDYSPDDPKIYVVLPILSLLAAIYYLSFNGVVGAVIFIIEAAVLYIVYKELVMSTK